MLVARHVIAALGILVFSGVSSVSAAPQYIRTSATEDPSTSFGIAWTTISGINEATVEYGTTTGTYPSSVKGTVNFVSATLGSVSEVTLTGLTPDTTYYYRVGGIQGGFSKEHSFRTAPKQDAQCGTFRFAVFGDSRAESWEGDKGASNTWKTISQASLSNSPGPDFLLHGGDIVYDGNQQKQWDNHLNATTPVSAVVPIMYTLGNHDDGPTAGDGANYNKIFHLPRASKALGGSDTEDYYFFTWGNALFISLSTESFSGGSIKFKDQADWMDQVLTQYPKRWKIVIMHRPIYTHRIDVFGLDLSHPPNEAGHNAAFVPVFNKHHVDIVFQSHNHFYERYAPSNCTNGGSNTPCPVSSFDQGTVYITTGGAGAFPLTCPFVCPGPINSVRVAASSNHHYVLVDIKDHTLTLKAIGVQGKTLDTLTIAKSVPSPDPCTAPPLPDAGPTPDASVLTDLFQPAQDSTPSLDQPVSQSDATKPGDSQISMDAQPPDPGSSGCSCRVDVDERSGLAQLLPICVLVIFLAFVRKRRS